MRLFPDLDRDKTKENAKDLLERYRFLKKIAEEPYTIKVTATYSFEPRSRSQVNFTNSQAEKQVIRRLMARQKVIEIEEAINRVHDMEYRQILIEKYCKYSVSDISLYMEWGLSESEFYRRLDKALLEFAEVNPRLELVVFLDGKDFDDFLGDIC